VIVLAACAVLLVVTMTLGVAIGSVPLSPATVWHVVAGGLAGHPENTVAGIIVWQIRLPRVLLAAAAVLLLGAFASLGVWAISVGSVLGALAAMAAVFLASRSGPGLAPTQLITESCAHVRPGTSSVSINDTYQDLRDLGAIFNERARAQKVIAAMQAQTAAASAKIAGLEPGWPCPPP
jgi:ABC-type Fe3+-siderophore transport system permease subunit